MVLPLTAPCLDRRGRHRVSDLDGAERRLKVLRKSQDNSCGAAGTVQPTSGLAWSRKAWALAPREPSPCAERASNNKAVSHRISHGIHLRSWVFGQRRLGAEQGLPDRSGEHVVEIKMQLAEHADAVAAGAVDRHLRLKSDLEVAADIDHAGIDRCRSSPSYCRNYWRPASHLRLGDQDQMVDEIGQLVDPESPISGMACCTESTSPWHRLAGCRLLAPHRRSVVGI